MKIQRNKIVIEEIEIPEGYVVCPRCEGRAFISKYDMGWVSVVPNAEMAAKRECYYCQGKGYVEENDERTETTSV